MTKQPYAMGYLHSYGRRRSYCTSTSALHAQYNRSNHCALEGVTDELSQHRRIYRITSSHE
jgi:hypothetical protein